MWKVGGERKNGKRGVGIFIVEGSRVVCRGRGGKIGECTREVDMGERRGGCKGEVGKRRWGKGKVGAKGRWGQRGGGVNGRWGKWEVGAKDRWEVGEQGECGRKQWK